MTAVTRIVIEGTSTSAQRFWRVAWRGPLVRDRLQPDTALAGEPGSDPLRTFSDRGRGASCDGRSAALHALRWSPRGRPARERALLMSLRPIGSRILLDRSVDRRRRSQPVHQDVDQA